ncbi:MAG: helix-turn-helix domain-containing protein [Chloroflexi bacterium]|nr:helix-turn-helix domain-containing protein [Chloroflexota bacterium]
MIDRLLSPNEIAELLGVSASFAYKLIRTGEIVSVRMGKSKAVRIQPSDLEAYVYANLSGKQKGVPIKSLKK